MCKRAHARACTHTHTHTGGQREKVKNKTATNWLWGLYILVWKTLNRVNLEGKEKKESPTHWSHVLLYICVLVITIWYNYKSWKKTNLCISTCTHKYALWSDCTMLLKPMLNRGNRECECVCVCACVCVCVWVCVGMCFLMGLCVYLLGAVCISSWHCLALRGERESELKGGAWETKSPCLLFLRS